MNRNGGRRIVQDEEEEDERVVYYDLDAESRRHKLLLVSDASSILTQPHVAVPTPTKSTGEGSGHHIFPRQPQHLFNLDDSGDEAGEEENPFESLLQQQTQKAAKSVALQTEKASSHGISMTDRKKSLLIASRGVSLDGGHEQQAIGAGSTHKSSGNSANLRPILKRKQQFTGFATRVNADSGKKLGFEAVDSRPSRWSARKPSPADAKNRRKSLGAIQKRRSQLEASAAKRRKSMPANLPDSPDRSTLDHTIDGSPSSQGRRLLSDVLQRATLLSQQQQTTSNEASFTQFGAKGSAADGDAILDTEHQMRAEPFAPQFFSPTHPSSTSTAPSRKLTDDAIISKIRGSIGDVIRKAIRKSNRELTLLRSHGQHLLPQRCSHSSPTASVGAIESIQDRAYIVICLKRYCGTLAHAAAYECRVHQVTAKLEKAAADRLKDNDSVVLEAQFRSQTAEYLKLSPGQLVKVFEPLHFFFEHAAAGAVNKSRWFLVSTQLSQVLDSNHHCAER